MPGGASRDCAPLVSLAPWLMCTPDVVPFGSQLDGCVSMAGSYMCWGSDTAVWEACPDDLLTKVAESGSSWVVWWACRSHGCVDPHEATLRR